MSEHSTHTKFRELLAEAASGDLSATQRAELEAHAKACASCREELRSIEVLAKLLSDRRAESVTDAMLQEARLELRARLRIERQAPSRWTPAALFAAWRLRPALYVPALGVCMMAVGLGLGYLLFGAESNQEGFRGTTAALVPGVGQGGSQITAVQFIDADASDGEVELAFQAVKPMRLKGRPDDPAIQKLLAYALVTEPNAGIRIRTVNTLTENAHPQTDPEIRFALIQVLQYDTNPGVRKQAMQALAKLPMDADIKHALLYVLANDPNEGLRIGAIDALLPERIEQVPDDSDLLQALKNRMQNENNNYIRLRTKAALQEVQP